MAYSSNIVDRIKNGSITYDIKDAYADSRLQTIQGDANTEGSINKAKSDVIGSSGDASSANTVYGAKAYADSLATNYDASGAATTAAAGVVGASTDASTANTVYGAKAYAKGLVDHILGEDSATTTLANLKQVIAELNDPANQNGITGTFVDTVKSDLAGLTKDDGNGGTVHATVKEYVDNAASGVQGGITINNSVLEIFATS